MGLNRENTFFYFLPFSAYSATFHHFPTFSTVFHHFPFSQFIPPFFQLISTFPTYSAIFHHNPPFSHFPLFPAIFYRDFPTFFCSAFWWFFQFSFLLKIRPLDNFIFLFRSFFSWKFWNFFQRFFFFFFHFSFFIFTKNQTPR